MCFPLLHLIYDDLEKKATFLPWYRMYADTFLLIMSRDIVETES